MLLILPISNTNTCSISVLAVGDYYYLQVILTLILNQY